MLVSVAEGSGPGSWRYASTRWLAETAERVFRLILEQTRSCQAMAVPAIWVLNGTNGVWIR